MPSVQSHNFVVSYILVRYNQFCLFLLYVDVTIRIHTKYPCHSSLILKSLPVLNLLSSLSLPSLSPSLAEVCDKKSVLDGGNDEDEVARGRHGQIVNSGPSVLGRIGKHSVYSINLRRQHTTWNSDKTSFHPIDLRRTDLQPVTRITLRCYFRTP